MRSPSGLLDFFGRSFINTCRVAIAPDSRWKNCLVPLIDAGVDQLVLGCTHYPFLRPIIEQVIGTNVEVIDPAPAVARQTGRVLARRGLEADLRNDPYVFYTSGDVTAFAAGVERLVPFAGESSQVQAVRWRDGHLQAQG